MSGILTYLQYRNRPLMHSIQLSFLHTFIFFVKNIFLPFGYTQKVSLCYGLFNKFKIQKKIREKEKKKDFFSLCDCGLKKNALQLFLLFTVNHSCGVIAVCASCSQAGFRAVSPTSQDPASSRPPRTPIFYLQNISHVLDVILFIFLF